MMSAAVFWSEEGGLTGFSFPLRIFNAVDLPIPFVPTRPNTCPGLGMGSRCNLKLLAEYLWVICVSRLVGRLMIVMAPKGHFFGQIPHPMQRRSDIKAIFESEVTSMQSLPVLTTGHDFLHSCRHFFGLHWGEKDRGQLKVEKNEQSGLGLPALSLLTIAMLQQSASCSLRYPRRGRTEWVCPTWRLPVLR